VSRRISSQPSMGLGRAAKKPLMTWWAYFRGESRRWKAPRNTPSILAEQISV
jgi:hypothetical protein